ncbi:MAG: hypothetical protein FWC10_06345 [Lentimicrobiaceae bacterium]|nr:hypothetical protein [Lentimicrobiaceae bacterium]
MDHLEQFGIVPIDSAILRSLFQNYHFPKDKIAYLEHAGKLIRLKRGVFVVSPKVSRKTLSTELIANHLYGPSYVSLETALRYYGLIPEQVYTIRSMTSNRSKKFENTIANFVYTTVSKDYYSIGIKQQVENDCTFLIATPEKALCDMIVATPYLQIQSMVALRSYLEEDLRFDMSALEKMNVDIIKQCIETGKKKNSLSLLLKLLQR